VNFDNIGVRQGGSIIFQSGPQSSPYQFCDLSYNIEYNITCFLDNGTECETHFEDLGTPKDSTFFYIKYLQCNPFMAEVLAIPNQDLSQGVIYDWTDGSSSSSTVMNEGDTRKVTTTSIADNCAQTYTYTLSKARVAIGGVAWKDNPLGSPNVLDIDDTERVEDIRFQLHQEDGTFIESFETGTSGVYQFYLDLPDGNYFIQAVNLVSGIEIVDKGQGADPNIDSDFNQNGRTDIFTIDQDCMQIENLDLGLK